MDVRSIRTFLAVALLAACGCGPKATPPGPAIEQPAERPLEQVFVPADDGMRLVTPEAEPPRAVDRLESRSPPLAAVAPPKPVPATHAVVRTWFGTNRSLNATPEAGPSDRFEAGRSDLRWGTCDVSIPRDHRMGEVERPSVWRFEFSEDPDAHVTVLATETTTHADWLTSVREKIAAANSHNAFIFVHGYNVSFADAARRTAQISYDLGFEGAPVFFTWPSQGDASSYTKDEQAIEWAQTDIRAFIESFLAESGAENVYIVAHSMGNRGVTRALAALMKEQPVLAGRITEIILAAPDIDADVFRRDIAPALISAGRPVTLYASSDDVALAASKTVHGFARAGDAGAGLVVVKGIDTIDATGVDASFLGHSYFADVGSVLRDLFELINDRKRPDARPGLVKCESEGRVHWTLGR